ncbi:hypothetical protein [Mycobacterium sp. E2733]|uniref:hypothetical protein n=1 Tax=Mycobacterium sp. E2733 TaxID=1834138 RepID=UPI0012EA21E2|nr:hypothetical protein [Mycobacterium sp. E2733]
MPNEIIEEALLYERERINGGGPNKAVQTINVLEHLHRRLDEHFKNLYKRRRLSDKTAQVFALEHDLNGPDLDGLRAAVRDAVAQGLGDRQRRWWLPFVIYAAELGYACGAEEYWPSFEAATPHWGNDHRCYIQDWFSSFTAQYGGAVPAGVWAEQNNIVCWPITNAVAPTYVQRHLARLLSESRAGLNPEWLNDPAALGIELAARSSGYVKRFRIFCENTTVLGQVAAALLAEDEHDSPYLLRSTLHRLLEGMATDHTSQRQLTNARKAASRVRKKGFISSTTRGPRERIQPLPRLTDAGLVLRQGEHGWQAYARLPDLSPLLTRMPHLAEPVRTLRARVAGVDGKPLARGRLMYPGQEVRLASWPRGDEAFIVFDGASPQVNAQIADHCKIGTGPWWLFKRADRSRALEVKNPVVRPGQTYCLVGLEGTNPPRLTWVEPATISVAGAQVFELRVPACMDIRDVAALRDVGISTQVDISIRPAGLVPSAWDGEGFGEWFAGEPVILAIRAEHVVDMCQLAVDGKHHRLHWPTGQSELLVALDGLAPKVHTVTVTLTSADNRKPAVTGSMIVAIREPPISDDGTAAGQGVRILAAPARPSLSEMWDLRAGLTIQGPHGIPIDLSLLLRDVNGRQLGSICRRIQLPMSEHDWAEFVRREVRRQFADSYNAAESCEVAVIRSGLTQATLLCKRGIQLLQWTLAIKRGAHVARLTDRTVGVRTRVELFLTERPSVAIQRSAGDAIEAPAHGGLLRATSGSLEAGILLPPRRGKAMRRVRPRIATGRRTNREVLKLIALHHSWFDADSSSDQFVDHQRRIVLHALTREVVSLIAGANWRSVEGQVNGLRVRGRLGDLHLGDLRRNVGSSVAERAMAETVTYNVWTWSRSESAFATGFASLIARMSANYFIRGYDFETVADFLLTLTKTPGVVMDWDSGERNSLIDMVMASPALVRAARFAVLGIEALQSVADDGSAGEERS